MWTYIKTVQSGILYFSFCLRLQCSTYCPEIPECAHTYFFFCEKWSLSKNSNPSSHSSCMRRNEMVENGIGIGIRIIRNPDIRIIRAFFQYSKSGFLQPKIRIFGPSKIGNFSTLKCIFGQICVWELWLTKLNQVKVAFCIF